LRTVVRSELPFEQLPDGLVRMAGRDTVGRTVVHVTEP
jgi:hypothetical protein